MYKYSLLCLTCTVAVAAFPYATVKRQVSNLRDTYDFIVAGGGTAGLTVADRLSEAFPARTVLVVEYGEIVYAPGPNDPPVTDNTRMFGYQSLPIPALDGRRGSVAGGQVVGGSSAVNGMFFDRGSRHDYDDWLKAGSPEFDKSEHKWDWAGIFPFFKKSVTFTEPSPEVASAYGYTWDSSAFGNSTPIYASYPPFQWPAQKVVGKAWVEAGLSWGKECAGGDKHGLCWVTTSMDPITARRSYSALGHYAAVNKTRPNYDLLVKHRVKRAVFAEGIDPKTAPPQLEIVSLTDGTTFNVTAKLEVILSTGAMQTPLILQRSGIGQSSHLEAAGVKVVTNLPGVGYNYQDHCGYSISSTMNSTLVAALGPTSGDLRSKPDFAADALKGWDETPARGPYTLAQGNSALYVSLPTISDNYADIVAKVRAMIADGSFATYLPPNASETVAAGYKHQLEILAETFANPTHPVLEAPWSSSMTGGTFFLKPLSRGSVLIDPKNVYGDPIFTFGTASNPVDWEIMAKFVPFMRKVLVTPTMREYEAQETRPGAEVQSFESILQYMKSTLQTSWQHPCCTAAMMPIEKGGVVGPDLKVHGLDRLRVVDMSIVPMIPGTHTSATAYAIGEKGADIIIGQWK